MSGHTYTHTLIHTHTHTIHTRQLLYNPRCACAPRVKLLYTSYDGGNGLFKATTQNSPETMTAQRDVNLVQKVKTNRAVRRKLARHGYRCMFNTHTHKTKGKLTTSGPYVLVEQIAPPVRLGGGWKTSNASAS